MNEIKAEFMKLKTPEGYMEFREKYKDHKFEFDRDMAQHLTEIARNDPKRLKLEDGDPRTAFLPPRVTAKN